MFVVRQAFLTTIGNATLAFAAYRLAVANGWEGRKELPPWVTAALLDAGESGSGSGSGSGGVVAWAVMPVLARLPSSLKGFLADGLLLTTKAEDAAAAAAAAETAPSSSASSSSESSSEGGSSSSSSSFSSSPSSSSSSSLLAGFEDLGEGLAGEDDFGFVLKLLLLSAAASYAVKYGELVVPFIRDDLLVSAGGAGGGGGGGDGGAAAAVALAMIFIPTGLNVAKWASRSIDPKNTAFDLF